MHSTDAAAEAVTVLASDPPISQDDVEAAIFFAEEVDDDDSEDDDEEQATVVGYDARVVQGGVGTKGVPDDDGDDGTPPTAIAHAHDDDPDGAAPPGTPFDGVFEVEWTSGTFNAHIRTHARMHTRAHTRASLATSSFPRATTKDFF